MTHKVSFSKPQPSVESAALDCGRSAVDIHVESESVKYTEDYIYTSYVYQSTTVRDSLSLAANGSGPASEAELAAEVPTSKRQLVVRPVRSEYQFRLERKVPRLGVMMVGWGGNNGSTLTASLLAHQKRLSWRTRNGLQRSNYFGSLVMASTLALGTDVAGKPVHVPFHQVLPMVEPETIVLGGWDISSLNLRLAMERACVLEPDLQRQVQADMEVLLPLPSIYDPGFIAANQADRADNVLSGTRAEQLQAIRKDIQEFKAKHGLDKVIVVWTANTERYASIMANVNDTAAALLASIESSHAEVAPSTVFGVAAVLEGCPFINGSPQNTFVPGLVELAVMHQVPIAGDDFKSGQTKIKSVLVDFLVGAGIKPVSITSYNHLGNNDGKNLSAPHQFRSKEISKSNVVDDMVASNSILYKPGESPNHVVVIKYVPAVGDSKRALDEYESEIFMGGRNTISIHNTCEDSLLASPLILDLALLAEVLTRVQVKRAGDAEYQPLHPVLSHLSYLLKAPQVPSGAPVVNALFKQRLALENFFRAVIGLSPQSEMELESRLLPVALSAKKQQLA